MKEYLGDGVYIESGSYLGEFILTAEDGINVTNRVVMDREMIRHIKNFLDRVLSASAVSIVCPFCSQVSYNKNDIEQKYCGYCHRFHEDRIHAS